MSAQNAALRREIAELEQLFGRMAAAMAERLCANLYKRGWQFEPDIFFAQRLREETDELDQACLDYRATPAEVWHEAADIANFAAMRAVVYETRYKARKYALDYAEKYLP